MLIEPSTHLCDLAQPVEELPILSVVFVAAVLLRALIKDSLDLLAISPPVSDYGQLLL